MRANFGVVRVTHEIDRLNVFNFSRTQSEKCPNDTGAVKRIISYRMGVNLKVLIVRGIINGNWKFCITAFKIGKFYSLTVQQHLNPRSGSKIDFWVSPNVFKELG